MGAGRLGWKEELAIIDRTMRAISGIRDPEELVTQYYDGIGKLVPAGDYVSLSRRNVEPPHYLITRSSRFTEHPNPWTEREKLPKLSGGLLGEIVYANAPVIIEDLPARLRSDDPGYFYLQGFSSLFALPQYDNGEGVNVTAMLVSPGRELDRSMIPMMHWQAGLFGRGTTNLVLRNQLSEALTDLDRELQVVGEIQRSLLPARLPAINGFDLAALYRTSARAGGDYYDFFPLPGGRWGLFIADVSGHGTPAAVLMAITHAIAHAQPGTHTPPGALLTYLNERLAATYTSAGTFVTAFYAILDPEARTLTYARAGHNPPRLARDGRVSSLDEVGSLPLGIAAGQRYEEAVARLECGDVLALYTDGITEAMAPRSNGEAPILFGVERLDAVLLRAAEARASECVDRVRDELTAFTQNAPPRDDQTMIAIKGV
jgi:sigma-B regulation protein RsbU (phosphoserine phosphatase)